MVLPHLDCNHWMIFSQANHRIGWVFDGFRKFKSDGLQYSEASSANIWPNTFRPHICHFFSTNLLWAQFCSTRKRINCGKITQNFPKFLIISQNFPHVEKFSISPQLAYMENWIFSTRQFFSTNLIRDIHDDMSSAIYSSKILCRYPNFPSVFLSR